MLFFLREVVKGVIVPVQLYSRKVLFFPLGWCGEEEILFNGTSSRQSAVSRRQARVQGSVFRVPGTWVKVQIQIQNQIQKFLIVYC